MRSRTRTTRAVKLSLTLLVAAMAAAFVIGFAVAAAADIKLPSSTIGAAPVLVTRMASVKELNPLPTPRPVVRPAPRSAVTPSGDVWDRLRRCESADGRTSRNGLYHGYFQFRLDTWRNAGGTGHPMDHSYEHQKKVAQAWLARTSWAQWPACSRALGLR